MSVTEVIDPGAVLTVPGTPDSGDFVNELRANAGILLGGVDWFAEKAFGVSPLNEYVMKPFAGDWTKLVSAGEGWTRAGSANDAVAQNFQALIAQTQTSWVGDAGDAFRTRMDDLAASYGRYGDGCRQISQLASALVSVSQSVAQIVSIGIGFIGSLLERLVVEASVPVFGWIAGAADVAIHIEEFWDKAHKIYNGIKRLLEAVKDAVQAIQLIVRILAALKATMNAFATLAAGDAVNSGDDAARKNFGVQ